MTDNKREIGQNKKQIEVKRKTKDRKKKKQ